MKILRLTKTKGTMLDAFVLGMLFCSIAPAVLFCVNLRRYRAPDEVGLSCLPAISVLIPARNEAGAIAAAVASVLSSRGVDFEVVVMDDGSTDRTAEIMRQMTQTDQRVRLEQAPALPKGWNGKQHACWALARTAKHPILCFVDADVRLKSEALARMAAFLVRGELGLVSGVPRQITETWMEWLMLPLIHFVLLGFLPLARMRRGTDPSLAAGCGQFIMVQREAYFVAGGHAAIRQTMHDGLLLPRLLRQAAYRTDLADLTGLAICRMYTTARQVWDGLAKNATEGLATPARILPVSLFLLMGQVMPFGLALWIWQRGGASATVVACALLAMVGAWLPRALAAVRFRQDARGVLLHPLGIMLLLVVQWYSLVRKIMGRAVSWKERAYVGD